MKFQYGYYAFHGTVHLTEVVPRAESLYNTEEETSLLRNLGYALDYAKVLVNSGVMLEFTSGCTIEVYSAMYGEMVSTMNDAKEPFIFMITDGTEMPCTEYFWLTEGGVTGSDGPVSC